MSRNSNSFLFLIGMTAICAVWLSSPFWKPHPGESVQRENADRSGPRQRFQYALPERSAPSAGPEAVKIPDREKVQRQLARRAHMEKSGLVKKVIENENIPEEVRSRFRAEKVRLDTLALQYPALSAEADSVIFPRQVGTDGELTPKFKEAVNMMKSTGDWDRMHYDYVRQLEEAAADDSLPPEERPTRGQIEAARSGGYIPVL